LQDGKIIRLSASEGAAQLTLDGTKIVEIRVTSNAHDILIFGAGGQVLWLGFADNKPQPFGMDRQIRSEDGTRVITYDERGEVSKREFVPLKPR